MTAAIASISSNIEEGELRTMPNSSSGAKWTGRIVKSLLYSTSAGSALITAYEVTTGGLATGGIIGASTIGGVNFAIAVVSGGIAITTLVLGCCSSRWMAERQLENDVTDLTGVTTNVRAERTRLTEEITKLKAIIENYKTELATFQAGTQALKVLLRAESDKFDDITKSIVQKADQLVTFKTSVDQQKADIKLMNDTNKGLKKNIDALGKNNGQLAEELKKAQDELKEFDEANGALKQENLDLKSENVKLDATVKDLKASLDAVKVQFDAIQKEKDEIVQKVGSLRDVDDKVKQASQQLNETEGKKQKLLDEMKEIADKLKGLEQYKETLQPLLDALKAVNPQ